MNPHATPVIFHTLTLLRMIETEPRKLWCMFIKENFSMMVRLWTIVKNINNSSNVFISFSKICMLYIFLQKVYNQICSEITRFLIEKHFWVKGCGCYSRTVTILIKIMMKFSKICPLFRISTLFDKISRNLTILGPKN